MKKQKNTTKKRKGRDLEELVAIIEKTLDKESKVESPAYIKGINSKRKREVDILITSKVGSALIKVAVECRSRKRKQGVEWIDSLIGKKKDISVDKLIVVTKSSFVNEVTEYAARENIELRAITEIDESIIQSWISMKVIYGSMATAQYNGYKINFFDEEVDIQTLDFHESIKNKMLSNNSYFEPAIDQEDSKISLNDIFNNCSSIFFQDAVKQDNYAEGKYRVECENIKISISTNQGIKRIHSIDFEVILKIEEANLNLSSANSYSVAGGNTLATTAQFSSPNPNLPIKIVLSKNEITNQIGVSMIPVSAQSLSMN